MYGVWRKLKGMAQTIRSPHLHAVLSQGRLLRFKKGESVSSTAEHDDVMLVVKGYVKRYMITNAGSLGVQILYGPQDVFSLTKVYGQLLHQSLYDGPEVYYYTAVCDTQLYSLQIDTLKEAAEQDPLIYKELFSEAGHHLKTCVHSIENISLGNAYTRVAHQLLFYAKEFGIRSGKEVTLAVPLTHQDIADVLGTSRETVTMAIIKLRDQGIISNNRRFSILNLDALEAAAYE